MLLAALAGWQGSPWIVGRLSTPQALDPKVWTVIVPGLEERMADSNQTDGTGLVDGTLTLAKRSFGRRDMVIPKDTTPIGAVTVGLAPWSTALALSVQLPSGQILQPVFLEPGGWRSPSAPELHPTDGPVRVELRDGSAWIAGKRIASAAPGLVEFSTRAGQAGKGGAAIRTLVLEDTAGQVLLSEDFRSSRPSLGARVAVAIGAAGVGAMAATLIAAAPLGGTLAVGLLLLAPLVVMLVPFSGWRQLCMQLYLAHTPAEVVRRLALGAALVPLSAAALLTSRVLVPGRRTLALPDRAIVGLVLASAALASRDLTLPWLLAAIPGAALLAMPWWTARRAGQPVGLIVARDLPALSLVALGTWSTGLLPALIWRLICLTADAHWFNRRSPRAGADAFLLTVLALPFGVEIALRGTDLPATWSRAYTDAVATDAVFHPFWQDDCDGAGSRAVYYFGGSSLGGAYQFRGQPESFFAARTHESLCARNPGQGITTLNFGLGGRDSWDIAHAVERLYADRPPAVTVLYLGINDIFTTDHPLTRKQRAAQSSAGRASSIATVNALALLVGPSTLDDEPVAAVPLPDAEENLRTIARHTLEAGGKLVLVPEYTKTAVAGVMRPYVEMEQRLADTLEGVSYFDLYAALADRPQDRMLADRNHLTHAGSKRVAEVLAPELERHLFP
jgi:lysophospholipase L1-like esterase